MTKKYKAKKGAWFSNVKANVYGQRIEKICKDRIDTQIIINDAKNISSPLHDAFEWNNTKASEKYREHQCRLLLNHLEIIIGVEGGEEKAYSAYLNISGENQPREYFALTKVLTNTGLRNRFLTMALKEAQVWQERYRQYSELSLVFEAIDKTKTQLKEIIQV